ncbi:unnamed protein product [Adineta steineri]|uniref:Uncharacterized protein n=1 Tax=Adineta steineri TaxID=433720 RepID=A0A819BI17_9BILA|nr:unnamed protein product [Adineta steineri]CAF0827736.1 unnamed protein product [Adineta steineri]CAF3701080.1 unnamed protein product [Adineta steineri]CAF3803817.1 unnamed protein product [Adineta steineri]
MEWTYSAYAGVNAAIAIILVIITSIVVTLSYCCSDKGQELINEIVIGVKPPKVEDDQDEDASSKKKRRYLWKKFKNSIIITFCLVAIAILTTAGGLIFEGCLLANARLLPNDNCPDYPMDCFVFNQKADTEPITQDPTFRCAPSNTAQFPSGNSDGVAVCFGWIIKLQSTKNILDQFGICTGVIGLFTTLLAIIIFLGESIITFVLGFLLLATSITFLCLVPSLSWSVAPITYAIIALGIIAGVFGIQLYLILPKPKDEKNHQSTPQSDKSSVDSPPHTAVPLSTSHTPKTTTTYRNKVGERQPQVFPESTTASNI